MDIQNIVFYLLISVVVAGAFFLVLSKSVVKSAYVFMLMLLGISGLFVFCGADFNAVAQIMVYIGGILILIVFGILLTQKKGENLTENTIEVKTKNYNRIISLLVGLAIFGALAYAINDSGIATLNQILPYSKNQSSSNVQRIGFNLLAKYGLELEVIGLLLLATLIGAGALAQKILQKNNG